MPSRYTKSYENRQPGYTDRYTFEYRVENDRYMIYCLEHPTNPFDDSVLKCHLYSTGKVCVAVGNEPRSLEVAEAIAHYFMLGYSTYIRTGTFPDKGARVSV